MFNFLKKKELELEFVTNTSYAYAYEFFPIKRSSRFIPNWFKTTPKSKKTNNPVLDDHPEYFLSKTVRGCLGIHNILTTGVVIPWWSDLQISTQGDDYRYAFADKRSELNWHRNIQAPGFLEDYTIIKIHCPWLLRSSEHIKFMVLPYFYADQHQDVVFMPGIAETLTSRNLSNLNFFLALKRSPDLRTYNFVVNTPAVHLIPLTENNYKVKNTILSSEEYQRVYNMVGTNATTVNTGFFTRKLSKCSFHNKD